MIDMVTLQRWLDAYVEAWRSNDAARIEALFSEDAVYSWTPFDGSLARGRQAIVEGWLKEPDDPESWECRYEALAVTADVGVARGWTRYRPTQSKPAREYANLFVLRFDASSRCSEFTEWYMKRPSRD